MVARMAARLVAVAARMAARPAGGGGRPDGVRVNRAKSNNGDCEVVSGSSLNSNTKNSGGSARLARVIAPVIIARSWWLE